MDFLAGSCCGTVMVAGSGSGTGVGSSPGSVMGSGSDSAVTTDFLWVCGRHGVGAIFLLLVTDGERGTVTLEHLLHIFRKCPPSIYSGQACLEPLIEA